MKTREEIRKSRSVTQKEASQVERSRSPTFGGTWMAVGPPTTVTSLVTPIGARGLLPHILQLLPSPSRVVSIPLGLFHSLELEQNLKHELRRTKNCQFFFIWIVYMRPSWTLTSESLTDELGKRIAIMIL